VHRPRVGAAEDSEIDFKSTYVGACRSGIDRLFEDERLEVYEVEPSDGVTWDADNVSPKPEEEYP
jgi:hypothetical protein